MTRWVLALLWWWAALAFILYACAPTIDYIKAGDPCRADSCEVVK